MCQNCLHTVFSVFFSFYKSLISNHFCLLFSFWPSPLNGPLLVHQMRETLSSSILSLFKLKWENTRGRSISLTEQIISAGQDLKLDLSRHYTTSVSRRCEIYF